MTERQAHDLVARIAVEEAGRILATARPTREKSTRYRVDLHHTTWQRTAYVCNFDEWDSIKQVWSILR